MNLATERVSLGHQSGFLLFDSGANSKCFTDGKAVIKVVRGGRNQETAEAKRNQLEEEYHLLKDYLGKYTLDSSFSSFKYGDNWAVKIEQDFVSGTPLRQSLGKPNPAVEDFFRKSLVLYEERGVTPDLLPDIMFDPTLGLYLTGRYRFTSKANVLLTPSEPILLDTVLNRGLRNSTVGPIMSGFVARRIQSLLNKMEAAQFMGGH